MNSLNRGDWERRRAAGKLAWMVRSVLLSIGWAALGASLVVWIFGGAWRIVLFVLAGAALCALLGSLLRWNTRERAYRADVAQEALHHLS